MQDLLRNPTLAEFQPNGQVFYFYSQSQPIFDLINLLLAKPRQRNQAGSTQ
jgi:hypothetical protein